MDLNTIYTNIRTGAQDSAGAARSAYQRDYDRIIFSSAFRRLQNKTQVFPLPGSVFVHNRLTHSLEVSSVGRSLGSIVGEHIVREYGSSLTEESKDFYLHNLSNVIAAACLCHDIGNPAFGHSGEDAIASYFDRNEGSLQGFFKPEEWADLVNFEGNSNAIRVLTQQQVGKDAGGLKLTYSTLASIAKYPCEALAKDFSKKDLHRKKFGFFQNEASTFKEIADKIGLLKISDTPLVYRRHPFVWLVEAADDMCYNIIDMEDAHRLGIVKSEACEDLFKELIEASGTSSKEKIEGKLSQIQNANERISYLRAKAINSLITIASEVYITHFQEILSGRLNTSLLDIFSKKNDTLKKIEKFSIQNIYRHRAVVEIENAGYNVMYELLDHFVPPILKDKNKRKNYDEMALQLLPQQFVYEGTEVSHYQKVLGVLDYVSGMTDNYATDLYRKIKGIDIGMTI